MTHILCSAALLAAALSRSAVGQDVVVLPSVTIDANDQVTAATNGHLIRVQ